MAQSLGELNVRLGADTRGLVTGFKQAGGTMKAFAATAGRVLGPIVALTIGAGGMIALVGALRSVIRVGAEFEQTMATVGGVMRATADEQERLTKIARRMGETTEWSATQAAEALQFLGMAGFTANKAIAALPGTLDLATAGQIDLGRAADIATNALTAMGLDVEQLSRVNDVFVGTITRSNTNMEMMAESFKYAAPMARAYGYSIEELSGLIGMLGNAGIQGSMAGTQLARAMMKAKEIAKKFGFESGDLVDVLESLRSKGYTASQAIEMFGGRAGKAAGVLFEATGDAKAFQEQLGRVGGEAESLANVMRDTLGGSFKELKSTVESLKLDVFEVFRDDLKGFTEDITQFIRENKDEIVGFAEVIKTSFIAVLKVMSFVQESMGTFVKNFAQTDFYKAVNWVADIFTPAVEANTEVWIVTQAEIDAAIEKLREMKVATEEVVEATKQIHQAKPGSDIGGGVLPIFALPDPIDLETRVGDYQEIIDDFHEHQRLMAIIGGSQIREQYDLLGEWMESWAGRISMGMQNALEHTFFNWMQGRIEGIRGMFQSLADDVFRMMSRMAAQKAAATVMESIGLGIPTFQHGGIVTQPTLALIGERGPEAVVPLSGRQDEGLLSRIASRMGGGRQDDRPMTVNVNISTPNPQAFRESKSQVAAQMAVALTAAGRNL